MFGNLFKPRSHYVFNYKPRYYDARKERIERLKEKYKLEKSEISTSQRRENYRDAWKKVKASPDRSSNRKILFIILLLVFLAYKYFKHIGISFF